MNKFLSFTTITILTLNICAQTNKSIKNTDSHFDKKLAIQQAKAKGMADSEIQGYINALYLEYAADKNLQIEKHDNNTDILDLGTMYVNSKNQKTYVPNSAQSSYCPNAGFEQLNFTNWIGSYGTASSGPIPSGPSTYNQSSSTIANSGGLNASLLNALNYHTIMTTPATNNIYPNCIGYDSLAVRAIGSQTISEIPVVNPYGGSASTRLNGAIANYRASKITYNMSLNPNNKAIKIAFAIVLNDGGHNPNEQPYFSITLKDQNGNLIPACSQYSFSANANVTNPTSPYYDPKWNVSTPNSFGNVYYRKWENYIIDVSNSPGITSVNIEFYVTGCTQGGHFGYAYIDAECSPSTARCEMCPGASFANLIAPPDFASYQWYDNNNNIISGAINDTLVVSSSNIGNAYSVNLTSNSGCTTSQTIVVATTTLTVNNISATSTCAGGNSGSATVITNGSNSTNSYTWTSLSNGNVVSTSQNATNLIPGNYSVNIVSGTCGQSSATITVPTSPPVFSQLYKTYCGNSTFIIANTGTNYQWYMGATPIPAPIGTNDTLFINNAINGDNYTLAYTNTGSCKDSIKYILNQSSSGNISITNITNVCLGNSNGSALLNLNPINSPPYTYSITNNNNTLVSSNTGSAITYSINNLSAGTYTSTVLDGNCIYTNQFVINTIQTNFTMTPGSSSSCSPADTARINFSFGSITSTFCSLSSGSCSSPNSIQIGYGTNSNSSTSYPSVYSNWYKNARHQILYKASELIAAGVQPGKISSISFNISAIAGTTVYPNFTIKMKCTNENDLSSTTFDNNGLTQVYFSALQNITTGWNLHSFPYPYEWDGISNILVDICSDITTSYTSNSSSPYTITSFPSVRWFNSDVTPACMTTNSAINNSPNNTYRPNIKFENCMATNPASYTISVSPNGTIVQNYNNDSIKIVPITTPTADIVYTITVTNPEGGCTASQTFTMSSNLAAYTTYTNASCGSCPNGSAQVIVSCGSGPYNYVWSPGGQTTSLVSGLMPGCYTVTVTDANLNSVSSQACISFTTKLDESSIISSLSIYPNPSNGIYSIQSESNLEKIDILVINPLGQTIFSETAKNTTQLQIDLSKMSKGIYYLKASTSEGTKLFKLILE